MAVTAEIAAAVSSDRPRRAGRSAALAAAHGGGDPRVSSAAGRIELDVRRHLGCGVLILSGAWASGASSIPMCPRAWIVCAWGRFHWLVVFALGITWILDGLEVTLAGAIAPALKASPALHLTDAQVGASASAYLAGAVLGAIVFGWLTDVLGRKRLFFITLGVYLRIHRGDCGSRTASPLYAAFRFLTGAGIGGEYAAINSAIQELVPPRYRGRTDLAINGSFWVGAALGSLGSSLLLTPGLLPPDIGWRCRVRHRCRRSV